MTRGAIAVFAAGLVLLGVVVAGILASSDYRTVDSNRLGKDDWAAEVPPGAQACQTGEDVPAGMGRIGVTMAVREGTTPPVDVRITGEQGAVLADGTLPAGWTSGPLTIPLTPAKLPAQASGVRFCVRNGGDVPLLIAGQPGSSKTFNAAVGRNLMVGRMRVDYLTHDKRSWAAMADTILDRFSFGKAREFSTDRPLWIALVLVLIGWALAALVVLRLARRP